MTTLRALPSNGHYANPDGVVRTLAEATGKTVEGMNQALNGPDGYWQRVRRDLSIACARGHTAWAAKRVEDLSRIVRQSRAALTPELLLAAQEADAAEDVAEVKYLAWQTTETLEEARRAKERAILREMAVVDAMTNELQRRGVR